MRDVQLMNTDDRCGRCGQPFKDGETVIDTLPPMHHTCQNLDASERYRAARNPKHSALGEYLYQFYVAGEAFTAGAQYALDRIVATADKMRMDHPHTSEYLTHRAADILSGLSFEEFETD
ncbi:hypothetical protein SEA_YORICK_38 [Mycobacterium phage Yorick]|nr:hypothetical protein SEA_YORICK_38 [Mycobacterium phage Yorick]